MMSGLWQGNYLTCCAAVRLIGYRNVLERFSQLSKIIDKLQEMCPYSLANTYACEQYKYVEFILPCGLLGLGRVLSREVRVPAKPTSILPPVEVINDDIFIQTK